MDLKMQWLALLTAREQEDWTAVQTNAQAILDGLRAGLPPPTVAPEIASPVTQRFMAQHVCQGLLREAQGHG